MAATSPRKVIIAVSNSLQSLLQQAVGAHPKLAERVNWLMGEFTGLSAVQLQHELVRRQLLRA